MHGFEDGCHPASDGVARPTNSTPSKDNTLKEGGWAPVFKEIYSDPTLPASAKAVYVALALRADNTSRQVVKTTHKKLHEVTGLSVSTVQRGLKIAEEVGLITRRRTGSASTYRLHDFNSATPYVPSQAVANTHEPVDKPVDNSGNPLETLSVIPHENVEIVQSDRSDRSPVPIRSVTVNDIQDSLTRLSYKKNTPTASPSVRTRVIEAGVVLTDFKFKRRETPIERPNIVPIVYWRRSSKQTEAS